MKITWLVDGVDGDWTSGYTSALASNRYRAIIPAEQLRELGHDVSLVPMGKWRPAQPDARPDVFVVGKLISPHDAPQYQQAASQLREGLLLAGRAGTRIVVDFCDDHFDHPALGPSWRALASLADLCIAGSGELRSAVEAHTEAPVAVVGDPVASPPLPARLFRPKSRLDSGLQRWLGGGRVLHRLRMVWFGHPSNASPLFDWAERLATIALKQPWWLTVVTTPSAGIEQRVTQFNAAQGDRAVMELVPWSEAEQWSAVEGADLVLIPADLSRTGKRAKTANRMTDALHAGRFVIASPVPAYEPFADYAALTSDPVGAVHDYLDRPAAMLDRVIAGQRAAIEHAAPVRVAAQWLSALSGGVPRARAAPDSEAQLRQRPAPEPAPVRLNLGCGDKILPGYVNVDVVESRSGKAPDVICDLRQLSPFPDSHADEVLAVHVVEHFWRWEIEEVLREWVRVLKPGGRMVLECPNLKSACEAFLANPDSAFGKGNAGQRTMWVFYGDPGWKDPLMVHRWGYTPESLAALMLTVGLRDARQEPAQFKLREPRDMRVVAVKPF